MPCQPGSRSETWRGGGRAHNAPPLPACCRTEPVQLLGRHWIIQDRHGTVVTEVPHGTRGVVGCTPIIKPGTCFQYYSAADLESAPGTMRGSFQMAVLDDRQQPQTRFDAEVAPFHFWPPPAQSG